MNATPKTIQIYLPGGDPRGIRIAEITTRIVQVIEVPRSLLPDFLLMSESDQVALYFLFSAADDDLKVYIGQTGDLRSRLASHNKEKDFWQKALVLISRTKSLTQTHALFLEWHCLQETRKAGRFADENGNGGSRPHTPAPLQADCMEIFETGQTLLATLGYPVFDPVAKQVASSTPPETFFCKANGALGLGVYTSEGFVVLKGSRGHWQNSQALPLSSVNLRNKLIESGVMHIEGENVVVDKDHLFGSPSTAAMALLGRSANGWTEWKAQNGATLDLIKRATPNPTL